MTGTVHPLGVPNERHVPSMLRYWAGEIEAGHLAMPSSAVLVLLDGGDAPPDVIVMGHELSHLEQIGALQAAILMGGPHLVPA